jgi:hypothetical protein
MSKEIALAASDHGLAMPYLPQHVAALLPLASVNHGRGPVQHLRRGTEFTDEQRDELRALLAVREDALDPERPFQGHGREEAVLALVTTMLLGFAFGDQSPPAADARFDLYDAALEGIPAWALAAGIARWARGECPASVEKQPNFKFAPCPATLRALCLISLERYEQAAAALRALLAAVSYEQAIDPGVGPVRLAAPESRAFLRGM